MGRNICRTTDENHPSPVTGGMCLFLGRFGSLIGRHNYAAPMELEYGLALITANIALLAELPEASQAGSKDACNMQRGRSHSTGTNGMARWTPPEDFSLYAAQLKRYYTKC
jgi:hypothetical protein